MATLEMTVDEMKARFEEDGYVILHNVIEQSVLDEAKLDLNWLVNMHAGDLIEAGVIDGPYMDEPFETRFYMLYRNCMDKAPNSFRSELHLPGLFGMFFNSAVVDLAESILGPEVRLYPNYTVRPKFPQHAATEVLWHQDAGYTATPGGTTVQSDELTAADLRMVNVWAPFVPVTPENGCMQFVPGTHKMGVVDHVTREFYLEIVESEIKPRLDQVVDVVCNPGDVVLFSNLLFHRGQPNVTKTVRWSADWRYQDATQPTLRVVEGHMARSQAHPEKIVTSADEWRNLVFK
jgi:ectoine hydroxylase-related dioxygenase (phytanoyl-CoA dioxygenase family)